MSGLLDKRLVVVSGKGGVGKSTIAAALALHLSKAQGLRTLLVEVNAQERMPALLGHAPVGPTLREVGENLWAVNIEPGAAMHEYGLMVLRSERLYRLVFENRLVRHFLRFIPSLQELVILGKTFFHLREQRPDGTWRFDRLVMDAPATGHALSLLRVPQVMLDTVPPGPLAHEAQVMRDLLVDPEVSAALLVSLPEELPVAETLELEAALRKQVRLPTRAVVLNAFWPQRFEPAEVATLNTQPALEAVAREHLARAEQSAEALGRLQRGTGAPVYALPRLFGPHFGRSAVEQLSAQLAPLLQVAP